MERGGLALLPCSLQPEGLGNHFAHNPPPSLWCWGVPVASLALNGFLLARLQTQPSDASLPMDQIHGTIVSLKSSPSNHRPSQQQRYEATLCQWGAPDGELTTKHSGWHDKLSILTTSERQALRGDALEPQQAKLFSERTLTHPML